MRARLGPGILLVVLTASSPSASSADEPQATALLKQGIALRREQRNEEALAAFEAANHLEPSPLAVAQIGLAQQALGRWLDAESNLTNALSHADDPWIARHRPVLETALTVVASQLGWLDLTIRPSNAQIVVDNRSVRAGTGPLRVPAGQTTFQVYAPGYTTVARTATVTAGSHTQVDIDLGLAAEPSQKVRASPSRAETRVDSPGGATGPTPLTASRTTLGAQRGYPLALLAGGGVLLAGSIWFGWRALSDKNQRDLHCTGLYCDATGLGADQDARVLSTVSTATFGLGCAAIAGGALWLLFEPRSRVRVGPAVGVANGVVVTGFL